MSDSASCFICDEGFLERLLDSHSALARHALQKAVFYVVPNMNPDGSWRGHLRTNAAGANLNREWAKPSLETSPEVTVSICQCQMVSVSVECSNSTLPTSLCSALMGVFARLQRYANANATDIMYCACCYAN